MTRSDPQMTFRGLDCDWLASDADDHVGRSEPLTARAAVRLLREL